jgi:hypothetical protein
VAGSKSHQQGQQLKHPTCATPCALTAWLYLEQIIDPHQLLIWPHVEQLVPVSDAAPTWVLPDLTASDASPHRALSNVPRVYVHAWQPCSAGCNWPASSCIIWLNIYCLPPSRCQCPHSHRNLDSCQACQVFGPAGFRSRLVVSRSASFPAPCFASGLALGCRLASSGTCKGTAGQKACQHSTKLYPCSSQRTK